MWLLGAEDVKANAGRLDPQVDHLWAQIMHLRYRRAGCHAGRDIGAASRRCGARYAPPAISASGY